MSIESFAGCDFLRITGKEFSCGCLTVPENHYQKPGTEIQISYVVISSQSGSQSAYPIIYLTGGPGGATLQADFLIQMLDNPLRNKHDLIFFDQRGINHSSALPNMERELFEIMASDVDSQEEQLLVRRLIKKYQRKAQRNNIDLGKYNSYQSARDVGMLMKHLGYAKYNLIGFSYGTRLARIIQDIYPDYVNSSILMGPNPLGGDFLISRLELYSTVLQSIFDSCRQQVECHRKYPNLETDYIQAVKALEDHPMKFHLNNGHRYVINAQDGIYWLRRTLYSQGAKSMAPRVIQALKTGDPVPIKMMIQSQWDDIGGFNSSMWISVERYEMFDPQMDFKGVDSAYRSLPLFPAKLGLFTSLYLEARELHHEELPVAQREYRSSNTPTLIFVNLLDPITPPADGRKMMQKLPNGTLLILDEAGHVGGNWECQLRVMMEFMNNPYEPLDLSCLQLFKP